MANAMRTQARETAKAKLERLTGKQQITNAVADRHLPPLKGEIGEGSASQGKAVNRAFGGWISGGMAKGRLDRAFAKGGRVKGKTTVNVIVGGGGQAATPPPPMPIPMPPPPPPGPPPGPPGGGGGGGNPLMQALAMRGAAAGGLGAPGPSPLMRKAGGRVPHKYTGGGESGIGRLEKIEAYGKRAREK
jgi:hypothetical protein